MASYDYQIQRPFVFTEEGQVMFLAIRDKAQKLLKQSGAVMAGHLFTTGDVWNMFACIDRLVELGELQEIQYPCTGQTRIFINSTYER
jgi:hypothetical protein